MREGPWTMAMIELVIPEATPSLNRLHGRHWSRYRRHRKRWSALVLAAKLDARIYGAPLLPRARVHITRYGRRILDPDNAIGGCKALIDGLKDHGLLADDRHIVLTVEQHIGEPRTIVRIEPYESASTG